ncbi:MAG: tetratricopeptide repeat protein [Desulfovibrionales bacterium]
MAGAKHNQTPKQKAGKPKTVSTATLAVVSLISLVVGFYLGFVIKGIVPSEGPANLTQMPQAQPTDASGQEQARIDALQAQVEQNPTDVQAWVSLGNLYFDTHQFQKAIQAYERSLELDPTNPNVWTDLGVMYRRSGRPEKAVQAFDQAVQVDPEHEIARFNKGIVLLHDLEDSQGALQSWEELLSINPGAKTPGGQPLRELVEQYR